MSGYEKRDVDVRMTLLAASALVIILIGVGLVTRFSLRLFSKHTDQAVNATPSYVERLPPEPRLEADPVRDLQALRKEENQRLTTYAWINRSQGVLQIPIERAIELIAQRGLPSRRKS